MTDDPQTSETNKRDNQTFFLLSDVLEASLLRKITVRAVSPRNQAGCREEAEHAAFEVLEACRVSGYALTLTEDADV